MSLAGRVFTTEPSGKPHTITSNPYSPARNYVWGPASGVVRTGSAAWRTESISESLSQKYVNHLSGAAGQRGKEVEDLSAELDLEMTREEEEKWDGDENNHSQVKAQINEVSYLNDLTQSSESASQDGDVFTLRTPCGK